MTEKIGIRYCGGCNSKYDRTQYVGELANSHPEWEFVYMDRIFDTEKVILVEGCERACARTEDLKDKELIIITSENYNKEII